MKKLISVFVIAISTITFAQSEKKTTSGTSKTEKMETECFSTKKNIPLTCVRKESDSQKEQTPSEKTPVGKTESKTTIKEDKKAESSDDE
jgi:hypothetical protein